MHFVRLTHTHILIKRSTFGERASDAIAAFGGSWTFILIFFAALVFGLWSILKYSARSMRCSILIPIYFSINLMLSILAAIQAPIIMLSQNRQSAQDRLDTAIDRSVNVRAELSIQEISERLNRIEKMLAVTAFEGARQQEHHSDETKIVD